MPLLKLDNIGKIYVSENNVAVGIRGVNLSFDKGEFVAITGKSGAGKSTLLNIISGMDTYEEGELTVEGNPTSHFMQSDWETYREKYISFIFQDYNIIESYTVLENVELALMHIESRKERREKAISLLKRVGLGDHLHHKGSKLSGGQKQRTVIARALAKDSPIILADEPTGNLDSATSKEIIKLLHEVSREKLLIVVTHNYEQVAEYATRHVRIYDGAVESDTVITPPTVSETAENTPAAEEKKEEISKKALLKRDVKNGLTLGAAIFKSKPKLSAFICLLLIVGTLGIFFSTTDSADILMREPDYMFRHIEGRTVVARRDRSLITEAEAKTLAETYGASSFLTHDILLDKEGGFSLYATSPDGEHLTSLFALPTFEDLGTPDVGRKPQKANEIMVKVPIGYRGEFGKHEIQIPRLFFSGVPASLSVVGVKYYYDNTIKPQIMTTREGFLTITAIRVLQSNASSFFHYSVTDGVNKTVTDFYTDLGNEDVLISFETDAPLLSIEDGAFKTALHQAQNPTVKVEFFPPPLIDYEEEQEQMLHYEIGADAISDKPLAYGEQAVEGREPKIVISHTLFVDLCERYMNEFYKQVSFFFDNDRAAEEAARQMNEAGFVAVPSFTKYAKDPITELMDIVTSVFTLLGFFLSILFIALFITLCTSRAIGAFQGEMSIMRSMGIPVRTIKVGMYVRMLLSLLPAVLALIAVAVGVFSIPFVNRVFTFLHLPQYLIILLGMLVLVALITHAQVRKLFHTSVKKALKGGRNT